MRKEAHSGVLMCQINQRKSEYIIKFLNPVVKVLLADI